MARKRLLDRIRESLPRTEALLHDEDIGMVRIAIGRAGSAYPALNEEYRALDERIRKAIRPAGTYRG